MSKPINYKFDEGKIIEHITDYINKTYTEHYAKDNKIQAFEAIVQKGYDRGLNFAIDNCLKYSWRQGDKEGQARKDIQKIIHYGILALYCYDKQQEQKVIEQMEFDLKNVVAKAYVGHKPDETALATNTHTDGTVFTNGTQP